ncbi:MAG: restriction endonuclease [candidate division Zixibacteria bacterium]
MIFKSYNISISQSGILKLPSEFQRELRSAGTYIINESISLSQCLDLHPIDVWRKLVEENKYIRRSRSISLSQCPDIYPIDVWSKLVEENKYIRRSRFIARKLHQFTSPIYPNSPRIDIKSLHTNVLGSDVSNAKMLCFGQSAKIIDSKLLNLILTNRDFYELQPFLKNCAKINASKERTIESLERFFTDNKQKRELFNNPRKFEIVVAEVLDRSGVGIIEVTQPSKDYGIDVIIYLPDGELYYVQCKAGRKPANVRDVREVIGVVARDNRKAGVLVALSGFTSSAKTETSISNLSIELVNAPQLATWAKAVMLKNHSIMLKKIMG